MLVASPGCRESAWERLQRQDAKNAKTRQERRLSSCRGKPERRKGKKEKKENTITNKDKIKQQKKKKRKNKIKNNRFG
jgi:hypothetical protein